MSLPTELRTPRLLLRDWRWSDRANFAALNADPQVMEHFLAPLSGAESDGLVDRIEQQLRSHGWGLWAVEISATQEFAGFIGLSPVTFEAPFVPAIEVGWRLARPYWSHGYATEGARAALAYGFGELELAEIVSFTSTGNTRSRRVMEKLGMGHDPGDDFNHPRVPAGHHLRRQVLYRLTGSQWRGQPGQSPRGDASGSPGI
ncbi:MAG: GNAT family N-acetyltransferase [Candidatus Dormiibacterota bacterium]